MARSFPATPPLTIKTMLVFASRKSNRRHAASPPFYVQYACSMLVSSNTGTGCRETRYKCAKVPCGPPAAAGTAGVADESVPESFGAPEGK